MSGSLHPTISAASRQSTVHTVDLLSPCTVIRSISVKFKAFLFLAGVPEKLITVRSIRSNPGRKTGSTFDRTHTSAEWARRPTTAAATEVIHWSLGETRQGIRRDYLARHALFFLAVSAILRRFFCWPAVALPLIPSGQNATGRSGTTALAWLARGCTNYYYFFHFLYF
jgi:hypothetical protein